MHLSRFWVQIHGGFRSLLSKINVTFIPWIQAIPAVYDDHFSPDISYKMPADKSYVEKKTVFFLIPISSENVESIWYLGKKVLTLDFSVKIRKLIEKVV